MGWYRSDQEVVQSSNAVVEGIQNCGRDIKLGFGLGLQLAGPIVPPRIIYQPDRYLIGIAVIPTQYPHLVSKLSRLFCINIYSYDVRSLIVIVTVTLIATAISNVS